MACSGHERTASATLASRSAGTSPSMIAPQLFELDDIDGHAKAIDGEIPADLEDKAHEAIRSCPEQAISIIP